ACRSSPAVATRCLKTLLWVSQLLREVGREIRISVVTQMAQTLACDKEVNYAAATMNGFCKTLSLEPGFIVRHIDVDNFSAATLQLLNGDLEEPYHASFEHQVAYRDGMRYVPRLVELPPASGSGPVVAPGATYLVTGGLGALGLIFAEWLVHHGATDIV